MGHLVYAVAMHVANPLVTKQKLASDDHHQVDLTVDEPLMFHDFNYVFETFPHLAIVFFIATCFV